MSLKKAKTFRTIRGKDLKLRYTKDSLTDGLIVQRQFYDQNSYVLTPITPKLLERQVSGSNSPPVLGLGNTEPRYIKACFGSVATESAESNFKIVVPYAPGDPNHNEHLREIFDYISPSPNLNPRSPLNISYHGENNVS